MGVLLRFCKYLNEMNNRKRNEFGSVCGKGRKVHSL